MKKEFLDIKTKEELAVFLEISLNKLDYNAYSEKDKYNEFFINKKNGKKRKILAPIPSLKSIQKKISNNLMDLYSPKATVHSYCKNRGIKTNAKKHIKKNFVLNIDLDNFFPSINFGRVRGMFIAAPFNFNETVATTLAQLCCHKNELPQGSPSSPVISNIICRSLDNQLIQLAKNNKCQVTRYSDDVTFSTNMKYFPKSIAKFENDRIVIGNELIEIIKNNGFSLNEEKITFRRKFEHQFVTGLTVNKKINIKRKFVRQIRAMLFAWGKYGLKKAAFEHFKNYSYKHKNKTETSLFVKIVEGKILFLAQIRGKDDDVFKSLLNKFQKLSPNNNLEKYLSYQGEKILIYTEGNTDWMHLKHALDSLSVVNPKYKSLLKSIKIYEYDPNYTIGDSKLKNILESHLLSEGKPIIGIFDSDNLSQLGEFVPKREKRYNNFDDKVYTFYLPRPSHRKTLKNCIEHYYKNDDLCIIDKYGRRIYLSEEFDPLSGTLKENSKIRCYVGQKKLESEEGIIDSDVRDQKDESLALSKKDFAKNIYYKSERFKKVNVDSFKLIFDIMLDIVRDIQQKS